MYRPHYYQHVKCIDSFSCSFANREPFAFDYYCFVTKGNPILKIKNQHLL